MRLNLLRTGKMRLLMPKAFLLCISLRMTDSWLIQSICICSLRVCLGTVYTAGFQVHVFVHLLVGAATSTWIILTLASGSVVDPSILTWFLWLLGCVKSFEDDIRELTIHK